MSSVEIKASLYKVTVGRISVACFASDREEAICRACEVINEQYPEAMIDTDTCVFEVVKISVDDIQFDEEVYG